MLNPSNGPAIINYSQCNQVDKCQNHQCFFRQRDVFGVSPWAMAYIGEEGKEMRQLKDEVIQKYGEMIFPEIEATIGTNAIYVVCKDYKHE